MAFYLFTQMSNYDMYHAIFVLKSWKTSLCRHMCVMSRDQLPKEISYSIVMRLNFSLYDIQFGLLDPPLGVDEYLSLNYYLVKGHVQFFFFLCFLDWTLVSNVFSLFFFSFFISFQVFDISQSDNQPQERFIQISQ